MSLSSSLNVHNVKRVTIEAEREYESALSYATRTITIETEHGQIEIILFSCYKKVEDEGPYMALTV